MSLGSLQIWFGAARRQHCSRVGIMFFPLFPRSIGVFIITGGCERQLSVRLGRTKECIHAQGCVHEMHDIVLFYMMEMALFRKNCWINQIYYCYERALYQQNKQKQGDGNPKQWKLRQWVRKNNQHRRKLLKPYNMWQGW